MQHTTQASTQVLTIEQIRLEVNLHGFCAIKLREFFSTDTSKEEAVYMVCLLAKQARLRVSFNPSQDLCVFEVM